jgi:hypothetical protein
MAGPGDQFEDAAECLLEFKTPALNSCTIVPFDIFPGRDNPLNSYGMFFF